MADGTSTEGMSIEELLAQRQQFEMWLDRLDQNDDLASEEIRQKVRGDYQNRLNEVLVELKSHEHEVTSKLAELKSSQEEFDTQRATAEATLTEAKVRHAVGEYDEGTWKELKEQQESALSELDSQLDQLAKEIDRLSEIQQLIGAAPAKPAAAEPPPAPESPAAQSTADQPGTAQQPPAKDILSLAPDQPAAPREPKSESPPPGAPTFTPRGADGGSEPSAPRTLRFPADQAAEQKKADELDFLKSVTEETPAGDPIKQAADQSSPASGGDSANQAKTLKCTECGAMNRPTEWYCEVCGAELASL